MFDRKGKFIEYKTQEQIMLVLKGDRLQPDLDPVFQQAMVVDAACWGWNDAIEYMINELGFSADDHDHKNYTPLGFAAGQGRLSTVKLLCNEYNVDLYARNNMDMGPSFKIGDGWFEGYTALQMALDRDHYHVARFLLEHSSDGDFEDHGLEIEFEERYAKGDLALTWREYLVEYVKTKIKETALAHWSKVRKWVRKTFLGPATPWAYAKHWMLMVANVKEERRIAMVQARQLDF